jgi:peptide/nickel transport system substrate-binding protein
MRKLWRITPLVIAALTASAVSACGSSSGGGKGTVTILDVGGGIDKLDPGYWYYQADYAQLGETTQRQLYGWPASATSPTPDLATALPTVSDGGKTLTITIKSGIKYSPPLQNRTVKAADIKYALTRCLWKKIGNGYAGSYFSNIVGAASVLGGKATAAAGIQAPNDTTLVLHLTEPVGVLATGQALTLPCSTPIPQDYAAKYDQGATSSYGEHQVFTGPYMIKGAGNGTVPASGYTPNKILDLVRNPSWSKSTDVRPANLNEIVVKEGFMPSDASRKILTGSHQLSGDFAAPPPDIAKQYLQSKLSQFHVVPSQGIRFIAMNPKIKPLDNVDVRRAIIAITDRNALRLTRGGPYIGTPATHMLPLGMEGFDLAGGAAGPGSGFYASPNGNLALAESYMKKAGYASGKYTGPSLTAVADNASPAKETAETFVQELAPLGFKVQLSEVPHKTMLSKFCLIPKTQPAFCPSLGWQKDFFDAQSMLDPLLNGVNIATTGNSNTAQLNDPKLNKEFNAASQLTDPGQRAQAYANIDKQVTAGAYYDVWLWDNQVNLESSDVNGALNRFNTTWDLTFSSLK